MASYNELLALIDAYINQNGVQAITGQVLNGVLRAMVDQLGRGYSIMGAADPTTDPGTPDGPETWFASVPGTYTNFDGIQIVDGELALLSYEPSTGFSKNTIYEGFQTVQATIDGNVGTPAVGVSYANGILSFDFHNMKGVTGDPAGFGAVTASVDSNIGTPSVQVQTSGPDTAKAIAFQFHNLKGETGVTSVLATVDNTSGNPQCAVSLNGQQLVLNFTGLKGAQGDTGSSVDYPFTIVNNLTTNDATKALSAAMGVQLESEVSQLEAKVDGVSQQANGLSVYKDYPGWLDSSGKIMTYNSAKYKVIEVGGGEKFQLAATSAVAIFVLASFTYDPTLPYTPTFATGESRRSAASHNFTLPTDARYVLIQSTNSSGVEYVYTAVCVGGIDYLHSLQEQTKFIRENYGTLDQVDEISRMNVNGLDIYRELITGGYYDPATGSTYASTGRARTDKFPFIPNAITNAMDVRGSTTRRTLYWHNDTYLGYSQNTGYWDTPQTWVAEDHTLSVTHIAFCWTADPGKVYYCAENGLIGNVPEIAYRVGGSYLGYINSNKWADINAGARQFIVLDLNGLTGKLAIKGSADGQSVIQFLSSFDGKPVTGTNTGIIAGSTIFSVGEVKEVTIPASAKFLYLLSFSTTNRTPQYVKVGSVDLLLDVLKNQLLLNEAVDELLNPDEGLGILDFNPENDVLPKVLNLENQHHAYGTNASGKCFVLLHFSDAHSDNTNISRIKEFAQKYASHIDDVISTGDLLSTDLSQDVPSNVGEDWLEVIGNHDATLHDGNSYVIQPSTASYNKLIAPFVSNWGVTQPANAASDGKCYYYKDYSAKKVRLIVLDNYKQGTSADNHWNETQKAWFESVLADTLDSNNSAYGYHVVVAVHYPAFLVEPQPGNPFASRDFENIGQYVCCDDEIPAAVKAFKTNGGKFVCYLTGHIHADWFGLGASGGDYSDQLCISIACASVAAAQPYSDQARSTGNKTQDCFNLFAVDTGSETLKLMRIGAEYDHYMRHKNVLCWDYINNQLVYVD